MLTRTLTLALWLVACRCGEGPKPDDTVDDTASVDSDGDGVPDSLDCEANDASIFPGAEELCDTIDNDCDNAVDESGGTTYYVDSDQDGYGDDRYPNSFCSAPAEGYADGGGDCDDQNAEVHPGAADDCDGVDSDCDSAVDEDGSGEFYADQDGDGYGDAETPVPVCESGPGAVPDMTDCDDSDPNVHPDAPDVCDGLDNDCDGIAESGGRASWSVVTDGTEPWSDASSSFSEDSGNPTHWASQQNGQLCISAGTYYTTLELSHDVSVVGLPGATLSGSQSDHVVLIAADNKTVDISNLTLEDGAGQANSSCRFSSLTAGGGLCCDAQGTSLSLANVDIQGSVAQAGAGLFVEGCDLNMTNGTVTGNEASIAGGGIAVVAADAVLDGVTVLDNCSLQYGGGIYVQDYQDPASLDVVGSTITDNTSGLEGGGLCAVNGSGSRTVPVTCSQSAFLRNEVTTPNVHGGGVFLDITADFSSDLCDFGDGSSEDNVPDDVAADRYALTFGNGASFECDNNSCQ
ncbi:MAG: putative metal-binding motif-containing protein [Alphaproteobacteria bacterium]|nr:putative metal-binding motif-containing protein [Alphaproteobacteria bacterium]